MLPTVHPACKLVNYKKPQVSASLLRIESMFFLSVVDGKSEPAFANWMAKALSANLSRVDLRKETPSAESKVFEQILQNLMKKSCEDWMKIAVRTPLLQSFTCSVGAIFIDGFNVSIAYCGSIKIFRSSKIGKKVNVTKDCSNRLIGFNSGSRPAELYEICSFHVEPCESLQGAFMIIVTEGIWSLLTNAEAYDIVVKSLRLEWDGNLAAKKLVSAATELAEQNNVNLQYDLTAIVVCWREHDRLYRKSL